MVWDKTAKPALASSFYLRRTVRYRPIADMGLLGIRSILSQWGTDMTRWLQIACLVLGLAQIVVGLRGRFLLHLDWSDVAPVLLTGGAMMALPICFLVLHRPAVDVREGERASPTADLHELLSDARDWLEEQAQPQEESASWYGLNNFRAFIASLETDPTASGIERACHALGWHLSDQYGAYKELPEIAQFNDRARQIAKAMRRKD